MPKTDIANFDPARIPDAEREVSFHSDATYVFTHISAEIVPKFNQNLAWIEAVLSGDTETLLDSLNSMVNQQFVGGMGAVSTSGATDWNDASNARAGNGRTLLLGSAAHGPGGSAYYHSFSFEYASKDGSGNMTQLAIPYNGGDGPHFRSRYSGTWSNWVKMWNAGNDGAGSGLDADLLDGKQSGHFLAASNYTASDVLAKLRTVDGAGSGLDADLLDGKQSGHFLAASSYTAADVLAKLRTVDGASSGLDADLLDGKQSGHFLAASSYTAADVLAKLKTVDGAGSGLDADLLDGKQSGHFLAASSYTAADVLAKLKTVDGAGSGLDADRVDGFQASQFLRSDTSDTIHGNLTIQEELFVGKNGGGDSRVHFYDDNSNTWRSLFWDDSANDWRIEAGNGSIQKLWHQGNDGSGSGLDADLLDGQQASAFARLSGASYSGTVSAPNFASTSDARLKSKIAQIGSALELVQSLTGVR